MIEDCPHGSDPHCCLPCQGARSMTRVERPTTYGHTITARYPGRCTGNCGGPIGVGDAIVRKHVGWSHTTC